MNRRVTVYSEIKCVKHVIAAKASLNRAYRVVYSRPEAR